VIIETCVVVGYNVTAVLSILLILSVEFKHIFNIINWLVLVHFALYDKVHHKTCGRKCYQRVHITLFKVE